MIPTQMAGVVLVGHGGLDKLVYRDDVPVPSPGVGEVLIRVHASSINNTDLNTRTGWYSPSVTTGLTESLGARGLEGERNESLAREARVAIGFPRIQGASIAGDVVAVGADVDEKRIGDRVVVDPVIRDYDLPAWGRGVQFVGNNTDGGYAQFAKVPSVNARRVESDLSYAELSCIPCAYSTAEEMLVRIGLKQDEHILVTGASGGVGSALIELARLRGARVIAVASSSKEEMVRSLGAEWFVPRTVNDLEEAVAHIVTDSGAIDAVADVVGGDHTLALLRILRRAGRYVTAGAIAGPLAPVDLRDLIYKDLTMIGVANPEAESFGNLVDYLNKGQLKPLVDTSFPLNQLREAQEYFMQKSHIGNVSIEIP